MILGRTWCAWTAGHALSNDIQEAGCAAIDCVERDIDSIGATNSHGEAELR